jgi:hypothetical protein
MGISLDLKGLRNVVDEIEIISDRFDRNDRPKI